MNEERLALREKYNVVNLGFWIYIMSDFMLFAALFATFMVLRVGVANGPSPSQLLDPSYALIETVVLLVSSFCCGGMLLSFRFKKIAAGRLWLIATLILGITFLVLELHEFADFISAGHSWQQSAFLSGFFALVGTHGLHITVGLLWGFVLMAVLGKRSLNADVLRKFTLFAIFWHFLDIVWIFIFTVVYLMGGLT